MTNTALPELDYKAMTHQQKADAFDRALQVLIHIADFTLSQDADEYELTFAEAD